MKAVVICVGTELVTGLVKDRNARFLTERLLEGGVSTRLVLFVPDDRNEIRRTLEFVLSDPAITLVILTGGLGPTEDDITREAISETIGRPLAFDRASWTEIEAFYHSLRRAGPPPNNRKQAMFPEGARILPNGRGTAPGFALKHNHQTIFVIPGVPAEVEYFWETIRCSITPEELLYFRSRILRFCGIGESSLEERIAPHLADLPGSLKPAFLPNFGEVWFYLYGDAPDRSARGQAEEILATLENQLPRHCFSLYGETTEEAVGTLLSRLNYRVAVAESCTGGMLSDRLTAVSGSSCYFDRGYVAYSNLAKREDLAVPEELLITQGAVSREVAIALAESVRRKAGVAFGLGLTGIAGPHGGTSQKPVGLVYVACAGPQATTVERFQFPGERQIVKRLATQYALSMLFSALLESRAGRGGTD
ncbi:MAG TPA: CinA family nicotinamide mononucleotide deamidase-related protein [Atribacteraceae bacterium]|nr:CinA family nicotinamide mononucleotide deamidase-related protein [Atribacteraceae bacterium]